MDPNEQEADQELIKAGDVEADAAGASAQGNEDKAEELEEKAQEMKEQAEQMKIDTESQINEANAAGRQNAPGS